ncbi:MAG TPA: phosphopantetheine-binding protein, partial [Puia sp.]|nr:phosphopantetheine-binding protein [Puia sp.]
EGGSRERAEHRQALRPEEVFVLLEWSVRLKGPGVLYETIAPLTERISRAYERKDAILAEESGEGASAGSLLAKRLAVRRERPSLSTSYEGPENRTEEILVEMLQDFFGIDKVGVTDSFFELGGDSLKAMVLLKKIRQEFRINMTVMDFFERQNIRQLAVEIEDKIWIMDDGEDKKFMAII